MSEHRAGPARPAPQAQGIASRRAAYRAIRRVHEQGTWGQVAVNAELRRTALDERDRAFAANLAYATMRWQGTLDWALAQVVDRPLADVDPEVVDLLRLGAWQLLRGGMPDRAAVDTVVELARLEVHPRTTGFVNGVLRGLARRRASLPWPEENTDEGIGLALGYPAWVVREARARFGDAAAPAVLAAGNEPPGVTLRARGSRDDLVAELQAEGIAATPGRWAPESVRAPGADPRRLRAVREGRATPQDEASMLVSRLAAHGQGGRWRALDVAAAPGGKATHLADLGADVVALDRDPRRLALVREAADRLGLGSSVRLVAADARRPPLPSGVFDSVLVDAPCTGLGVVRRRPELRWRRTAEDVAALAGLQRELLTAAAPLVRPGGRLTYSVCTWSVSETRDVVLHFASAMSDSFVISDVAAALGGARSRLADDPGVQLRPDTDGTDGMYVCSFQRVRVHTTA